MRILGIDPSLCNTGWGMIDITEDTMTHIAHGVIKTPIKLSTEKRLSFLSIHCKNLIAEHTPDIACIEETFCGLNPVTNLRLGFASGAILCTFGIGDVPVFRYPTRLVKFLVTTRGGASKFEVRDRVVEILSLESIQSLDSSDALAVAVAHVLQERRTPEEMMVKRPKRKKRPVLITDVESQGNAGDNASYEGFRTSLPGVKLKKKSKKLLVLSEPEKTEEVIIIAIPTKKPRKAKQAITVCDNIEILT